jgi:hypothetical protein
MLRFPLVLFLLTGLLPPALRAFADESQPDINSAAVLGSDPVAKWVLIDDEQQVTRHGQWELGGGGSDRQARNRYCWPPHLRTDAPGAKLELEFEGTGIVLVFHTPQTPAYGPREMRASGSHWVDGLLRARIDDGEPIDVRHNDEPLEVVLADDLAPGRHRLVLEHVRNGCTLLGFRVLQESSGHLTARVSGENASHLFDVRVSVWRGEELVRTWLHRNWLCDRVAVTGLPPGEDYRVRIDAVGWEPWEREGVRVVAGRTTELGDPASTADGTNGIFLRQDPATDRGALHFPAIGNPAVRVPGEAIELKPASEPWREAKLTRKLISHVGPSPEDDSSDATVSRQARVEGNVVTLPDDVPPGLYDLHLVPESGEAVVSPRSVVIRETFPKGDLTILTWGHTDTWGQHQAEFEQALVSVANVIGPDLVLVSNSVNAAYIAGAMADLDAPYLINFGNHRLPGHEHWHGSQVGVLDLGPEISVFNFGSPWSGDDDTLGLFFDDDANGERGGRRDTMGNDKSPIPNDKSPSPPGPGLCFKNWSDARQALDRLVADRRDVPGKIVNAYEGDAPVEWMNRHEIRLIHAAHGGQRPKVGTIAGTSTMHVGKRTASSFRIVRMEGHRVVSATDPPLELARVISEDVPIVPDPPLRVVPEVSALEAEKGPQDGGSGTTATVINEFPVSIDSARVLFLVPAGDYRTDRGRIERTVTSDDGQWSEITVRLDLNANSRERVTLRRK